MSTFFEKLTGARQKPADAPADTGTPMNPKPPTYHPPLPQTEKRTTLKVATEPEPPPQAQDEDTQNEEGELTVDIYDRGDAIVIQSTVAGVKPDDLDVSITDEMVTIRGKRECVDVIKEDHYYYKELFWGTFSRAVLLPEEIDSEKADASLQHGLLTVVLPKKRKAVAQKLKVKVN